LKERKPHYQIIPYNEVDTYKFLVQNENIENITIILNSITGDADIQVEGLNNTYKSASYNDGYTPDVITIQKKDFIKGESILGEYLIKVKGNTFASYSLLYYTHENESKNTTYDNEGENVKPIISNIIELETGQVIRDFVMEHKNNTNYKVYSYNPRIIPSLEKMDIRITLTPEHSNYKFYVLFDIENLKINTNATQLSDELVENYIWVSNYSNEIIIKKDHPLYRKDSNYYIVIVPKNTYNDFETENISDSNSIDINNKNDTDQNSQNSINLHSFYYLGVTTEFYPFILQESFPSTITLDSYYTSQSFFYFHYNISNPLSISLNLFYGRVDLYVDFKWSENMTDSPTVIKILNTDSTFLTIPPEKLKENSQGFPSIPIYILIKSSNSIGSQFLISIKSDVSKPEQLKADFVKQDSLVAGEYKYFFLNLRNQLSGIMNVAFKFGYGDVYINIYDSQEFNKLNNYPNVIQYMYKADDNMFGKSFLFNNDILSKCKSGTCKILISVQGSYLGYNDDKIEYMICYYQDALMINQNQPYKSEINEGEMKFFRLYFPENTQNAYISLTNMGSGDADLYVNYGDDFPSLIKYNWESASPNPEFVEFNANDNYFVSNNRTDISGNYTILVYGFSKTSYTLYISAHPKKIVKLEENTVASCITTKDDDYCYFRLNFFKKFAPIEVDTIESYKTELDIILNTEFIYGGGIIYTRLYNGNDYDILQDFPNEHLFDYSNVNSNIRNFLRLNVHPDNPNYKKNSTLLITVKCNEKCFFDITATKKYQREVQFFDSQIENIFYISKSDNKKNLFIFYVNKEEDLDVQTKALEGKANITIYTNETYYDNTNKNYFYKINQLHNYESSYPDKEIVHKKINSTDLLMYANLFFEVNPITDYTFITRITYRHDWNKIKLGKENVYKLDSMKNRFYGYFHMHNNFENVLFTVSLNKKNFNCYVYVKYIIYEKAEGSRHSNSTSTFDAVPNENDNDYSGNNFNLMNIVMIRLPNLEKDELINSKTNKHKLVKVLFTIMVFEDYSSDLNHDSNDIDNSDFEIKIMATPEINNISKSVIPQRTVFYSLLSGYDKTKNSTIHIYDLKRKNIEDDTLIVEISSCKGAVDMVISKKMLYNLKDAEGSKIYPSDIQNSNGRIVYTFSNIDTNNFYMALSGRRLPEFDCMPAKKDKENIFNNCNNNFTNVLIYYYTMKSNEENRETFIPRESLLYDVIGRDKIKLKWTSLMEYSENNSGGDKLNPKGKYKNVNATYNIYISNSFMDYIYMDSVCYLNHMNSTNLKFDINHNEKEAIIYGIVPFRKYFINVLVKKSDTDVLAYKSIEVILETRGPPMIIIGKLFNIYINNNDNI